MLQIKSVTSGSHQVAFGSLLLICLLSLGSTSALSQDRSKPETIEATAMGTGTQLGKEFSVTLIIYEYSPRADKQILVEAFQKGKDQGLVNALSRMKAMGHIAITGTLGYDVSYIRVIPTPTGRRIRFITNRPVTLAENWYDTRSSEYNLSGGELDLNETDKTKSTGVFYPLAKLTLGKDGEVTLDLATNPWKLVDILDWGPK